MNNLMSTDVKMTSLDIAEVTGKRHADLMRDIRNEIESLGREVGQRIFALGSYMDKNNQERPCFNFNRDGAMQLALKYDAKTRYNVIKYIEELENKPTSQLEVLQGTINQLVQQENRITAVENKQEEIKDIFSMNTHNWRNEVNRIINTIAKNNGGSYSQTRNKSYNDLEIRARCNLEQRLSNMIERAQKAGAQKREINQMNYLDVIERDDRLVEIYLTIVKEMAIKYGVESDPL